MKVNLGCGHVPLAGYVNVDKYANEADIKADVLECEFEDVEELVAYHLLEHLKRGDAHTLLTKAKRWMAPGGTLEVETPDMRAIIENGLNGTWETWIYGAQEHEGEFHLWGYTRETLSQLVTDTGWTVDEAHRFHSRLDQRPNMPCVSVRAHV